LWPSGPPAKTTVSGPVWSHQVAARVFALPFSYLAPVGIRPAGRSGRFNRRGCASTLLPGASNAASAGVVMSASSFGCR
jgi:hypothetical protein